MSNEEAVRVLKLIADYSRAKTSVVCLLTEGLPPNVTLKDYWTDARRTTSLSKLVKKKE